MVWETSRCPESYRLVWAVTVERPRCSGIATARTVPLLTGRNIWLVDVIVAVVAPSGQSEVGHERSCAVGQGHQDHVIALAA